MLHLPDFSLAACGCLFRLLKAVERLAEELGFIFSINAVTCETANGERAFHVFGSALVSHYIYARSCRSAWHCSERRRPGYNLNWVG